MSYKHDIIRFRRGTTHEWASSSPQPDGEVLKLGEPGYEKDTGKIKIGDGITGWNNLPYTSAGIIVVEDIDHLINDVIQAGSGIDVNFNDNNDTLTISSSGVNNPLNNSVLTSDGSNTGIAAQPNLSFDGIRMTIKCSCSSGSSGLTVIGDQRSTMIRSNVYSNPRSIETEDGILTQRDTSRLIFLNTRGTESSPSGLEVGDTIFIIRGDAYNPYGTLNAVGTVENRSTRIMGTVSNSGTSYLGSSLTFQTTSGSGSQIWDHSMIFDHDGDLIINNGLTLGSGSITFPDDTVQTSAGIPSNTALVPNSISITNIVSISQANYDAIVTKDSSTLYIIS